MTRNKILFKEFWLWLWWSAFNFYNLIQIINTADSILIENLNSFAYFSKKIYENEMFFNVNCVNIFPMLQKVKLKTIKEVNALFLFFFFNPENTCDDTEWKGSCPRNNFLQLKLNTWNLIKWYTFGTSKIK